MSPGQIEDNLQLKKIPNILTNAWTFLTTEKINKNENKMEKEIKRMYDNSDASYIYCSKHIYLFN